MTAIAPTLRPVVLSLYDGACHYRLSECSGAAITIDHIVPLAVSNCHAWWNLAPACYRCNQTKADALGFCSCWRCAYATEHWRELKRNSGRPFWPIVAPPKQRRRAPTRVKSLGGFKSWKFRPSVSVTLDEILEAKRVKGPCYAGGDHLEGRPPNVCLKCNALLSPLADAV